MADGAKPDVPTTDRQNEKKKKRRPFYEAVDAHARRRLISFRAEHSDADRDITGIEGLLFRNRLNGGEKKVLKI